MLLKLYLLRLAHSAGQFKLSGIRQAVPLFVTVLWFITVLPFVVITKSK